jgi:hypothetical protein
MNSSNSVNSIIFSCWTRTLNLIASFLDQDSVNFERIDGECPLPRRQKILDDFRTNSTIPVLIMTTGTGAYGYEKLFISRCHFRLVYILITYQSEPHLCESCFHC